MPCCKVASAHKAIARSGISNSNSEPLRRIEVPLVMRTKKDPLIRPTILVTWGFFICTGGVLISLGGCGGVSLADQPDSQKIQHVVIIFQENRTPDNLFHGLPNADIANRGLNSRGQTIPLTPVSLASGYDLDHSHTAFVNMYDHGEMDGADKIAVVCTNHPKACQPIPSNAQFRYVNPSEVAPYFQMAQDYTFGDRMFQTNQGPSFPAHQFIIAGTSAPSASSDLFASSNPGGVKNADLMTGCAAPAQEIVALIDPKGRESSTQYPCFEHPILVDLLDTGRISWRYYTPSAGSIWTGPNAIRHLRFGPDWARNVVLQPTQFFLDLAQGQFAAVNWIIPAGQASDHAGQNDGSGPSWVASIVNTIGDSPYWYNTVIFITWDDWGGWYDHVAPTIYNSYEYGFRVPLIVVSPYAKAGYVSHVTHDFGSILRFVERNFSLPSLGYADARADDLSDCLDYSQAPLAFRTVLAPWNASQFLQDNRPPSDPDD
jgi:phospholipase C